jgi:preprotein translocase subunit SecE
MAKDQGVIPAPVRPRAPAKGPARPAPVVEAGPKRSFNPVQFFREVRAEMRKVTWTSWKETWITSVMVGIMVVLTAAFFFGVDALLSFVMNQVLKLGSS